MAAATRRLFDALPWPDELMLPRGWNGYIQRNRLMAPAPAPAVATAELVEAVNKQHARPDGHACSLLEAAVFPAAACTICRRVGCSVCLIRLGATGRVCVGLDACPRLSKARVQLSGDEKLLTAYAQFLNHVPLGYAVPIRDIWRELEEKHAGDPAIPLAVIHNHANVVAPQLIGAIPDFRGTFFKDTAEEFVARLESAYSRRDSPASRGCRVDTRQ